MLNWLETDRQSPNEGDVVFVRGGHECWPEDEDNAGPHQVGVAKFVEGRFCDYFYSENWYEPNYWALVPPDFLAAVGKELPSAVYDYLRDRRGVPYPEEADKEPARPTFASEGYDISKLLALARR